ncbi:hypothetical protein EDC01DRAFT_626557 [Geopyxis carbonaria]|nr:hypothetical protein EDC01DRAFT_626557 [Geopyxis carbonaria]
MPEQNSTLLSKDFMNSVETFISPPAPPPSPQSLASFDAYSNDYLDIETPHVAPPVLKVHVIADGNGCSISSPGDIVVEEDDEEFLYQSEACEIQHKIRERLENLNNTYPKLDLESGLLEFKDIDTAGSESLENDSTIGTFWHVVEDTVEEQCVSIVEEVSCMEPNDSISVLNPPDMAHERFLFQPTIHTIHRGPSSSNKSVKHKLRSTFYKWLCNACWTYDPPRRLNFSVERLITT